MDKESSVGTQYIICECGDNFPNEKFLNIHLANDHANVETFICNVCPASFTSKKTLLQHKRTHESETPMTPELKTYARKTPTKQNEATVQIKMQKQQPQTALKTYMVQKKTPQIMQKTEMMQNKPPQVPPKTEIVQIKPQMEKKINVAQKNPPVIKVQNLKRINSISLIQSLKSYGGFIKIEPSVEPPAEIEVPVEEPRQVLVKNEAQPETEESTEEIYYQCDVCNSIFYTEAEFNVHYQSTHAMKQEPTPEQILEDHLVTDHGDDVGVKAEVETAYYFECEICHKIFASEKYFNIHYNKVHGGLLPLDGAQEHMDEDTQEEEAALSEATQAATEDFGAGPKHKAPEQVVYYKCDLCKILYPSEKAYNTHFDKKHGQSCQEMTGFQFIEQQLTEECSPMPEPEFHCEFCPKSFSLKRSLQVHRKRAHLAEVMATAPASHARAANRSKVCDICGRAYNSNAALRYHQRRHTGEKPYPCTVCPKRFTMPMFLQIHMRTHTGEKPYECPHCPKAFTNKAALIRHDRVHTGVKPYPCPECGKFFTQSNSMKLHVSTVHLKLPAPYKSARRRSKSEARALQLALKAADSEELVLGE